jgi:hypothetical protein
MKAAHFMHRALKEGRFRPRRELARRIFAIPAAVDATLTYPKTNFSGISFMPE